MREMRWGVLPCTSLPSNTTVPVSGILKPEMRSMAVLLPAPLGPINPVIWPSAALKEHSLTASTPPKCLHRPRTSRSAVMPRPGRARDQ
jgi:hypothetical protein